MANRVKDSQSTFLICFLISLLIQNKIIVLKTMSRSKNLIFKKKLSVAKILYVR